MIPCIHHFSQSNDSQLLAAIIPVVCVILGILISEIIGSFRRRREISETGQNFITQIISAQKIIAKQIDNNESYATDLKEKIPLKTALELLALLDFKRIGVFNRLHIYKFFKRICKGETKAMDVVDELYASIDAIGFSMDNVLKEFYKNTITMTQLGEEANVRMIKIKNEIGDWWIRQGNINQSLSETDQFYRYLVDDVIKIILNQDNSYHILELNDKLFHPLINKCIEYQKHELANSLMLISRECSNIIYKMNREKNSAAERIEAYSGSMKKQNDTIKKLSEDYKLAEVLIKYSRLKIFYKKLVITNCDDIPHKTS